MIYIGTRKQRNELGNYIDDIDMQIYAMDKKRCSEEQLAALFVKRDQAKAVIKRGFGFVSLPRKQERKYGVENA